MTDFINEQKEEEGYSYSEIILIETNNPKELHDIIKARHMKDFGKEPCFAEIQEDMEFINRCKHRLRTMDKRKEISLGT